MANEPSHQKVISTLLDTEAQIQNGVQTGQTIYTFKDATNRIHPGRCSAKQTSLFYLTGKQQEEDAAGFHDNAAEKDQHGEFGDFPTGAWL